MSSLFWQLLYFVLDKMKLPQLVRSLMRVEKWVICYLVSRFQINLLKIFLGQIMKVCGKQQRSITNFTVLEPVPITSEILSLWLWLWQPSIMLVTHLTSLACWQRYTWWWQWDSRYHGQSYQHWYRGNVCWKLSRYLEIKMLVRYQCCSSLTP